MNDEFYIGWEAKAAPGIAATVRRTVVVLLALAVALALGLALAQHAIGVSVFEWGKVKEFSGVLKSQPYPHLLVARPGVSAGATAYSSYYLVQPFKFGLNPESARQFDGKAVRLRGTLIYRENQTMIEVVGDSLKAADNSAGAMSNSASIELEKLGRQTFIGEIVDSKCFLGVMNPGQLTPHSACAIRCISGGIPPVLLVRPTNSPPVYLLLVSAEGKPVNHQVLDMVAEPVEITGEVERQGDLLILRADPATYRRL